MKLVLVKNGYFLYQNLELHIYQQMNGFLYWRSFYWKNIAHVLVTSSLLSQYQLEYDTIYWYKSNLANESPVTSTSFNFVSLK